MTRFLWDEGSNNHCNGAPTDRPIKGNETIILVSSLMLWIGSPIKSVFDGVLRNNAGVYLSRFSGYIHNSSDILQAELFTIYQGLLLAKTMDIDELARLLFWLLTRYRPHKRSIYEVSCSCCFDSRHKKNWSSKTIYMPHFSRREPVGNFMAKLRALSDIDLLYATFEKGISQQYSLFNTHSNSPSLIVWNICVSHHFTRIPFLKYGIHVDSI